MSGCVATASCWSSDNVRTAGRLAAASASGSLLIFLVANEGSAQPEYFLAAGESERRKEARAPLSSVSHSSPLTHICFPPASENRLKPKRPSHQDSAFRLLTFFEDGGCSNFQTAPIYCT